MTKRVVMIEVEELRKSFWVNRRRAGFGGSLRGLVSRDGHEVQAVDGISFSVEAGEMVGYIGPNGAGKSTTIKVLTGILVPSGGRVTVAGLVPWERRRELAGKIGAVFGQRTQLWWDLPLIESLTLLQHVYGVPAGRFNDNLKFFREILELDGFLDTPVRQLSLGQRMRGDLVAALLHEPPILYLDEPTIGLDVVARARIREVLLEINRERGVTVLLTTHDMADIAQLCRRMMIIDRGKLLYDGSVEAIRERFGVERTLIVDLDGSEDVDGPLNVPGTTDIQQDGPRHWLRFRRDEATAAEAIAAVTSRHRIRDLTLEEPEIEGIVRRIYEGGEGVGALRGATKSASPVKSTGRRTTGK
jgi:ABC-2 type transport system ATP-binding protein